MEDVSCLYADIADGGCALRATADSPPPTAVQMRESIYRIRELEDILKEIVESWPNEDERFDRAMSNARTILFK